MKNIVHLGFTKDLGCPKDLIKIKLENSIKGGGRACFGVYIAMLFYQTETVLMFFGLG